MQSVSSRIWTRVPVSISYNNHYTTSTSKLYQSSSFRWKILNQYWFNLIKHQNQGVPQGSILSVTLFNIKINSITNYLNTGVEKYLFIDDFCITSTSRYIRSAEHQLQQGINKINKWAMITGLKISKTKTLCIHFCQLRKMHYNLKLNLDGSEIPVIDQYKFLGIIFDKKLFHPTYSIL